MFKHAIGILCTIPAACFAQQVTLVSRHSEARETRHDALGVVYDNMETFDGPGDWRGVLPRRGPYSSHASDLSIGGRFDSYVSSVFQGSFMSNSYQSSMQARIDVSHGALLHLSFSAEGTSDNRYTRTNANFSIVSVDTGEIIYEIVRDAPFRQIDLAYLVWDPHSATLELGAGRYDILMSANTRDTFSQGSGSEHGAGRLQAEITITPIPAPASILLLAGTGVLASRRRRAGA